MPHASELEEFGLEVEEEEHHALIVPGAAGSTTPSRRTHANAHSLSLSTPSKEQRHLLQSANIRPSRFLRPGILKWATLVMALAIAVFLHLGRESAETEYVEEAMPDVEVVCEDEDFDLCAYARKVDPGPEREGRCRKPLSHEDEDAPPKQLKDLCRKSCGLCDTTAIKSESNGEVCEDDPEFTIMVKSERSCASFVANVGRVPLLESRCNRPIGIPDENKFQKLLKHFCRKSCGLCGTKDTEVGVSEAVIEAEVDEVAQEIEEKELKDEIDKEMEEIELEKDVQKEMEEQEKELEGAKDGESNTESESEAEREGDETSGENEDASEDTAKEIETGSTDEQSTASVDEEDGSDGSTQDTGKQYESGDTDEQSAVSVSEEEVSGLAHKEGDRSADFSDKQNSLSEMITASSEDEEGEKSSTLVSNADIDAGPKNDSVGFDSESSDDVSKEPTTSGQKNDFGGTLTLQHIKKTREVAQNLIEELDQYYFGAGQTRRMLIDAWLSPWEFEDQSDTGRERFDKLVDTFARALVTDGQSEFIIGTIGSSVAAGHDNCHYDSYEKQLERTFGPVLEAAGMGFVHQNAGEGGGCGDDYKNQVYCVKQNISPNVDIVHYSWTYFEEGDDVDKYVARESLIRWTQMLPHQPPVQALSVLWKTEENKEFEMANYYAKYGYNIYYLRQGHKNGGYDYEADEKNGIDHYAPGFMGDGYHSVTRYGENEADPDRKESLSVNFRNWHPGPLAFQLASDAFAYVYSKAILASLGLIETHMATGKDPRETWSASKRKILLKRSLPVPKYCDPRYCVVDEAPGCLNYEKPTFGFWGAKVEDPNDHLNPHKGELQKWKVWHEEIDFWHMVGKQDTAVFQSRDDKEKCKHLDQCGGISATSRDNGMVVFRLPKMEVGLVSICGCCGKTVAEEMFIKNPYIEIMYNGAVLNSTKWDIFPTDKCARLLDKFPTAGAAAMTPTGHAYLSIKALEGLEKPVRISHVITL